MKTNFLKIKNFCLSVVYLSLAWDCSASTPTVRPAGLRKSFRITFDMKALGKKTFTFIADKKQRSKIVKIMISTISGSTTVPNEALKNIDSNSLNLQIGNTRFIPLVGYEKDKPDEYFICLGAKYVRRTGFVSTYEDKEKIKLYFDKNDNFLRRKIYRKQLTKKKKVIEISKTIKVK